ncbi:histone-lysine N-methyltransferase SETMAR [Plakobranchus ocellatus]|uniref:Histone-lysine N-methyltransferase SETMAR n=1 Tax=Plakobranchus ocellatus TaxID=259542 RepID=A0AAV4AKJ5_9GAST|nr:histone-lysine N-methyltransferase SETMAR [Plakobranchus ocellatus]
MSGSTSLYLSHVWLHIIIPSSCLAPHHYTYLMSGSTSSYLAHDWLHIVILSSTERKQRNLQSHVLLGSSVHEIVHDTLGYRKVSARWVRKMLTKDHKLQRVEISQRLLQRCQQDNGDENTTHIGVGPGGDFQANNNLFDNLIMMMKLGSI